MFSVKKMDFRLSLIIASAGIMILLNTSRPKAQDIAVGQVTATVQAVLAVTATAALAFGNVFQGVSGTVANSSASAGVFTISGQGLAGISLYLQLPAYMATATGDDRMQLAFGTADVSIDSTANVNPASFGVGWQNTDPNNLPSAATIGGAGGAALFLGGKVTPTVDQSAGAYSADIILTVSYNGT